MSDESKAGEAQKMRRQVAADETTRRGVYSNEGIVSHGREEFSLDFCYFSPLHPNQGQLVARVILSPPHAKRLLLALQENVAKYERRFGEIAQPEPTPGQGEPPIVQ